MYVYLHIYIYIYACMYVSVYIYICVGLFLAVVSLQSCGGCTMPISGLASFSRHGFQAPHTSKHEHERFQNMRGGGILVSV